MESKDLDYKVLARYLAGEGTAEDGHSIKQWALQSLANQKKLAAYNHIWNQAAMDGKLNKRQFDADQDWKILKKQIERQNEASRLGSSSNRSRSYLYLRVAAIFLVVVFIGFIGYRNWTPVEKAPEQPVLQQITTDMGQRANLVLSDGTRVLLNADSRLKMPEVFEAGQREVFLQGEAYFEVASNPDKPFIIHLQSSDIRVLGTSFAVRAYPEAHQVQVVVKEGRVAFHAGEQPDSTATIITEHELVHYSRDNRQIETRTIKDLSLHLSWIDGYLKFKEAPMSQVATALERRYAVEVVFEETKIKNMMLTALLKGRSIENVLDVIAASLKIEYRLEDNQVVFLKK